MPLAAIKVILDNAADIHGTHHRLQQWFWCGVFGELYGSAIESRFARDVEQVPGWARSLDDSVPLPKTIDDANFFESRLHSMRTRNSAAYKGVYAMLMAKDTRDWMFNQPFTKADFLAMQVDIHHIFPKAWCAKNDIDEERRESIVNKTPMAKKTNIKLSGNAPSVYIKSLESVVGIPPSELDQIVANHQIAVSTLRADDFDAFFSERREALSQLIEVAMGKPVARESASKGVEDAAAFEPEPEDPEDELNEDALSESEL